MKILFNVVLDLNRDGAGVTHFTELARSLSKNGNEILALCPGYYPNKKKDRGFRIIFVPTFKKNILSVLFYEFLNAFYLAFWILKFKPDVIYSRCGVATIFPPIIAFLFRKKYFMEINGILIDELKQRGYSNFVIKYVRLSEMINFALAFKIICVSEGILRTLNQRFEISEDKLVKVENGVNIDKFYPISKISCRNKLGIKNNKFIIGFIGSLAPWHGLEYLIEALIEIKENHKETYDNLLVLIIGDGEERQNLLKKIKQQQLDCFCFYGWVDYDLISFYINSFDICIAPFKGKKGPTSALGSPLKMFEYMACGKPIIASYIDGVEDIFKAKEFIQFVTPGDARELAKKIQFSFNNLSNLNKNEKKAREIARKYYSWDAVASRLAEILRET